MDGAKTPAGTPDSLWCADSRPFLGGNVENGALTVWETQSEGVRSNQAKQDAKWGVRGDYSSATMCLPTTDTGSE